MQRLRERSTSRTSPTIPSAYLPVKWIPPKWDWVDPFKDRKAEIEAVNAGLKSRSDVIESEGYDAEEVDRRIAADKVREQELGLSFGGSAKTAPSPDPTMVDDDDVAAPVPTIKEDAA
jgi:capsid protein